MCLLWERAELLMSALIPLLNQGLQVCYLNSPTTFIWKRRLIISVVASFKVTQLSACLLTGMFILWPLTAGRLTRHHRYRLITVSLSSHTARPSS